MFSRSAASLLGTAASAALPRLSRSIRAAAASSSSAGTLGGHTEDAVVLQGMTFFGRHGVLPEEAVLGQKFVVDLRIYRCLRAAGVSDRVEDTVDYSRVVEDVRGIVEGEKRYQLIEALAHDITETIFGNFDAVEAVDVCVKKPQVALMASLDYSAVEVRRRRTPLTAAARAAARHRDRLARHRRSIDR